MQIKNFVLILMLFSIGLSVGMVEPLSKDIQTGDEVFLGTMGPGQTLQVSINPFVYDSEGEYVAHYDQALAIDLPEGWKNSPSKLYDRPNLQTTVTSSPDAKEGDYRVILEVVDEENAEGVENIEFVGIVRIDHDVLGLAVEPKVINTGANQPAKYFITITNKGSGSDVFEVSSENIQGWEFTRFVFVPPESSKTIPYEIVEAEEESYSPTIRVKSTSSNIISAEENIELKVESDLFNDLKALNNGTPMFPILQEPIFAFLGLLSNLF